MTDIYHITHISNLPSIIQQGGLYCDNLMLQRNLHPQGIAHQHIKERRTRRIVNVAAGGTLADYVPFYFAPRSPMLYTLHKGNVAGYNGGQGDILHLVSTIEHVTTSGRPFAFTDGHAELAYSFFFDDLAHLDRVDWALMQATYWRDTIEDSDRKRRRQAEFLVYQHLPWAQIHQIGVIDQQRFAHVAALLHGVEHRPEIIIQRHWYYN